MAALKNISDALVPLANRNWSAALKAMDQITQKEAAKQLGCAESSFCDFKEDHLERAMQFLAALGLKVVPKDDKTMPPAEIAAYKLLARKAMEMDEATSDWGRL